MENIAKSRFYTLCFRDISELIQYFRKRDFAVGHMF